MDVFYIPDNVQTILITKGIQRLHIKVRNLSTHVMLSTNTRKLHNFSKMFYFIWTFILLIKITIYLHWEFVISYNVCYIGIHVIIYRYSVEKKKTEILLTFKICLYKNDHLFALGIGHLVPFYIILIVLDLSVKNANSCIHLENVCKPFHIMLCYIGINVIICRFLLRERNENLVNI